MFKTMYVYKCNKCGITVKLERKHTLSWKCGKPLFGKTMNDHKGFCKGRCKLVGKEDV